MWVLFFIAYSWYRRNKNDRQFAEDNAGIFLDSMHLLAYLGIIFFIYSPKNKLIILIVLAIVIIQFWYWFWHKNKWKKYINEFKTTSRNVQKKHVIYLFIYFLLCLTPLILGVVFNLVFNINLYR